MPQMAMAIPVPEAGLMPQMAPQQLPQNLVLPQTSLQLPQPSLVLPQPSLQQQQQQPSLLQQQQPSLQLPQSSLQMKLQMVHQLQQEIQSELNLNNQAASMSRLMGLATLGGGNMQ